MKAVGQRDLIIVQTAASNLMLKSLIPYPAHIPPAACIDVIVCFFIADRTYAITAINPKHVYYPLNINQ